jgi:hypothetical protein
LDVNRSFGLISSPPIDKGKQRFRFYLLCPTHEKVNRKSEKKQTNNSIVKAKKKGKFLRLLEKPTK